MRALLVAGVLGGVMSCATTTRTRYVSVPQPAIGEVGTVDSVSETVATTGGDSSGGALAVGLLVPLLFHDAYAPTLFASATGLETRAATSNAPPPQHRTYEVSVTFDDGNRVVFSYDGSAPWETGDRVVIARHGLVRAG
jgi:hypothetical protein